jgi:hypothetical protein
VTSFTDRFGGSTVQPSDVGLRVISLSANIVTVWPPYATADNECARIMKVSPTAGTFSITLPDAMYTSAGTDIFFDNAGGFTFTVLDSAGGSVATIAAGQVKYLYLSDNTTSAGSWRVMLFGASSSNLDASQLAGPGLLAIGSQLAQASVTTTITSNTTLVATDRANLFVNTGGNVALTLPLTSTVGGTYFVEARNQGTGALTLTPVGGETIDGSGTVVLQINESCFIQAGSGAWYTVGHGRNQQFNFTQLTKTVTGGTTTLSLSEASNVVQTYSGVLVSAETLVLPAIVQVYYVSNNTTGAYTFTVKNPGSGATLVVPQGQSAVVFSDGTNVTNASTSVGGITSLSLAAGAAASPSLSFVNANNGLFAPTGITVGVSANGTEVVRWAAGQTNSVDGTVSAPAYSFLNSLTTGWYSPAVGQIALAVAGVQKLLASATSFIVNKVTITPPATGSTLTIADGKTLTVSLDATVSGTNTGDVVDATITTTDVVTNDASTSKHGWAVKAVAPAAGLINVVGIANGETAYTNKALLDTTNPAALGSVGPGTATVAARRDHIHANPAIDTLAAATDITTLNASTSAHGLALKATAPAAGTTNLLGIANGETVYSMKAATNANTVSTIVARDGSGNFSAGTITAALTGNASGSSGSCTGNAATASAVAVGGITGLGTGIATALAVNAGSTGAPILQGGAASVTTLAASGNITGYGGGHSLAGPTSTNTDVYISPGSGTKGKVSALYFAATFGASWGGGDTGARNVARIRGNNTGGDAWSTMALDIDWNNSDGGYTNVLRIQGTIVTIPGTLGVTGAITGNLTGNASGTAATVTGAAQTAITSVGTLTALTVSGAVSFTKDMTATSGGALAIEAVIAPTLLNSWANLGGGVPAGYWKDAFGCVHIQGNVSMGTSGTDFFVLPTGYRPTSSRTFPIVSGTVSSFFVGSSGHVTIYTNDTSSVSIGDVSFRTT